MSPASPTPPSVLSDEALPPVQPPSAGFLVQLFVIPGLIVLVMVLVWMLIKWLPQMGNDAETNVKALEGSGANRWQAAVNLANLLRGDTGGELKRDRDLAARLADKLEQELADGRTGEDAVLLRVYLATALGEFYVDTGLPALVLAIETEERTDLKPSLRTAATRAVAVLSSNLRRETGRAITDPDAVAAVIDASRTDDSLLRTTAAFALGEIGGDAAQQRLRTLLDDVAHPYARYNAATALARRGEPAVIEVVVEMLATHEPPETSEKDTAEEQAAQRTRLVIHGLQAASELAAANSNVDLRSVIAAVEGLTEDESRELRQRAKLVLQSLRRTDAA
ncbi:MAG: HEAT repeat domain-containing protein [Pirellulales bacterium]